MLATSPASIDFDRIDQGDSLTVELQLVNVSVGPQTVVVASMSLSETDNFSLDVNGGSSPCGSTTPLIGQGGFCTVEITFEPTVEESFDEALSILSNASATALSTPIEATSIPCGFPDNVVLSNEVVSDTRTEQACDTLTAGPSYSIVAPGNVTLRADDSVILRDGFSLGDGAQLAVENF